MKENYTLPNGLKITFIVPKSLLLANYGFGYKIEMYIEHDEMEIDENYTLNYDEYIMTKKRIEDEI